MRSHAPSPAWLLFVGVLLAPSARATCTIVPTDYATIQAAIASAADTIYVADGVYPEHLFISRDLELLPLPAPIYERTPFPEVGAITLTPAPGVRRIGFRDFHARGPVQVAGPGAATAMTIAFEACRMDSGFASQGDWAISVIRGCLVFGGASTNSHHFDFSGNTVIGGGLTVQSVEEEGDIRGNYFAGPAPAGIQILHCDADVFDIEDNVITGTVEGIRVDAGPLTRQYGRFHENTISDVSGTGFHVLADHIAGMPIITHNTLRRCGGYGFDLGNVWVTLDSNLVEDVALDGVSSSIGMPAGSFVGNRIVRAGGAGMRFASPPNVCSYNTVLSAGGDGLVSVDPDMASGPMDHNIVGRCAGAGLRVPNAAAIAHNTSYLNQGAGFVLDGLEAGRSVDHNIAFQNGGPGLHATTALALACNDWRENTGGATAGIDPGASDVGYSVGFCDLSSDDVALGGNSPLANLAGCGLVGALGVGCGSVVTTPPIAASGRFVAWPQPTPGTVHFAWAPLSSPAVLEVFDASGRRVWSAGVRPGAPDAEWSGAGDRGQRLAPGVYIARLIGGGRAQSARVVRIR